MRLENPLLLQRPLERLEYFQVVQTSLTTRHVVFARQAILNWLGAYPGDLFAGLLFARALVGESRDWQAFQILRGLSTADPEFQEAVALNLEIIERLKTTPEGMDQRVTNGLGGPAQFWAIERDIRAHYYALNGRNRDGNQPAAWGGPLWFARQEMAQGNLSMAEDLIEEVWNQGPAHPLAGVTHLQSIMMNPNFSLEQRNEIAKGYYERWPDTLFFMLLHAHWSLELGHSKTAVALLHQAAARDIGGQVALRVWGSGHPYRSLWPEKTRLKLNLMIPAEVIERLNWNRLPVGKDGSAPSEDLSPAELTRVPAAPAVDENISGGSLRDLYPQTVDLLEQPDSNQAAETVVTAKADSLDAQGGDHRDGARKPKEKNQTPDRELSAVEQEFENLARRLNLPGVMFQDGRFPVYVMLSFRGRLQSVYGPEIADLLECEMQQLGSIIQSRPGWGARVFFADDPHCTRMVGSKPVKPDDPWGLKLLLTDLDQALGNQGERIGALLIVGGPEIVPFHHLPNPVNDPDVDVPSDNPYATRDENYFIPEWPVGRLPGGTGSDARILLGALRRFQKEHMSSKKKYTWLERVRLWITESFHFLLKPEFRRSFGYTAEIWKKAAAEVFSPIGRPVFMHESPPSGVLSEDQKTDGLAEPGLKGIPKPVGRLGYFNLHGLINATEWFGHRDFAHSPDQPDFPIALRPQDITPVGEDSQFPRVIFSEACYGMHLHNRSMDEAIALKFLEAGSLAVVGSTSMAYGSISANPMYAADLLGHTFWRFLKQGMSAGEALRQAKIYLVSEMNHRQGFLDGEDQKTLISFVLYGDPLAEPLKKVRDPKTVRYQSKPMKNVRAISDAIEAQPEKGPVPVEVMDGVRRAVAKYLPGMSDAQLEYVCEPEPDGGQSEQRSDKKLDRLQERSRALNAAKEVKNTEHDHSYRSLVTLSKKVARSGEIHPQIARLRLDEHGKLVKLVVSR